MGGIMFAKEKTHERYTADIRYSAALRRRKYSFTNAVDLTSINLRYFSIEHFLPSSYGAKLPMDRVHGVYHSVPLEPCNEELKFAAAETKNRWDSNTQTLEGILQY